MATSKCTACSHGSTWHENSTGACKLPICNCARYSQDNNAKPVLDMVTCAMCGTKYVRGIEHKCPQVTVLPSTSGLTVATHSNIIQTTRADKALMPEKRHETQITDLLRVAAVKAIAQVQAGVWQQSDLLRVAEVGAARGCERCREFTVGQYSKFGLSSHLTPTHVAEAFALTLTPEMRDNAYSEILEMLAKGETSHQEQANDWVRGWRQFKLLYDTGGLTLNDGLIVPQTVFPRPWLAGAQGGRWISGDYQAHCSGKIGGRRRSGDWDYLTGDAARQQCLEHYSQSGRSVNQHTLEVTDFDPCSCGVYAVTNRHGVYGGNSATSVGIVDWAGTVKAITVAYGTIQVGADGESWRATDGMLERLIFYPQVMINGESFPKPVSTEMPYVKASVEIQYRQLAEDLAEYYQCPVTFASAVVRDPKGEVINDIEEWTVNPKPSVNWNLPISGGS